MKTSFFSEDELDAIGLRSKGKNLLISRMVSFYSPETIEIGDHVRIDDFCILSGSIKIGSNVHISAYVALYGSKGIFIGDYSGISSKTIIYSAVDDFSGEFLIGPMAPPNSRNVIGGPVYLGKYSQVGASCVVMPALEIAEGCIIGSMSFVNKVTEPWSIYVGIPAKRLKDRSRDCLQFLK